MLKVSPFSSFFYLLCHLQGQTSPWCSSSSCRTTAGTGLAFSLWLSLVAVSHSHLSTLLHSNLVPVARFYASLLSQIAVGSYCAPPCQNFCYLSDPFLPSKCQLAFTRSLAHLRPFPLMLLLRTSPPALAPFSELTWRSFPHPPLWPTCPHQGHWETHNFHRWS